MIETYVDRVGAALSGVLELLMRLALPLGLALGVAALAGAALLAFGRDGGLLRGLPWARAGAITAGCAALALLAVSGWAALSAGAALARQDLAWRAAATATANPVPDAPPVTQYGPVAAALEERTYSRSLTLPPGFLDRVGAEGVAVLSPYLSDPSAENVLRLADTFRRSGKDVIFTREMTRLAERPLALSDSRVTAKFNRLSGRAYDLSFEARYSFRNPEEHPINARLQFPLPEAGTVRDLAIEVNGQALPEPANGNIREWTGTLAPGEGREAVVRYRATGAGSWNYDIGSQRRKVDHFVLDVTGAGGVRFTRGSLQPTSQGRGSVRWDLTGVVTAQQVALAFPPDTAAQESYMQTLAALPVGFLLLLVGAVALGALFGQKPGPGTLAIALALFGLGLGAIPVMAHYVGGTAGVILGSVGAAGLAGSVLGRRHLLAAVPAALFPAAFLSPEHTGLIVLLLAVASLAALWLAWSRRPQSGIGAGTPVPA